MLLTHVPRVCWLKPMVQKLTTFFFGSAYNSASRWRRSAGTPESLDTFSRVYSETNFLNSSKFDGRASLGLFFGLPSAPG